MKLVESQSAPKSYWFTNTHVDVRGALAPNTSPPGRLRRVQLKELALTSFGQPARGCALHLTNLCPPVQLSAVHLAVEDEEGTCVCLSLYNCTGPNHLACEQLLRLYPVGAQLIIKDPYLKIATNGRPCVRLDHPVNLVVVDSGGAAAGGPAAAASPWSVESADQDSGAEAERLKAEGNRCFERGQWEAALQLYERALGLDPPLPLSVVLRVNRAQALLNLGCYCEARSEARAAVKLDPTHVKGRYRLALAEAALGRHGVALSLLQSLVEELEGEQKDSSKKQKGKAKDHNPLCSSLRHAMAVVRQRLEQRCGRQLSGESLWELRHHGDGKMTAAGEAEPVPGMTAYVGPVEVRQTGQRRGRGLFVTRDVAAGEVLLVEPPLAAAFAPRGGVSWLTDWEKGVVVKDCSEGLLRELLRLASTCPLANARVLSLYDGTPEVLGETPAMVLFRCDDPEDETLAPLLLHEPCSVDRLRSVIRLNSFGCLRPTPRQQPAAAAVEEEKGTGLWALSSFMNHSSRPNVDRRTLGLYMVVVAPTAMTAGTELLTEYVSEEDLTTTASGGDQQGQRSSSREEVLRTQWGIEAEDDQEPAVEQDCEEVGQDKALTWPKARGK